ncbi:MAG TPA: multicopper oxidase domain-containing protein [Longimicrobiales bacterium]
MTMPTEPKLLSDLVAAAGAGLSRRNFLAAVPLAAVAGAIACDTDREASQQGQQEQQRPVGTGTDRLNSNSRLDTALVHDPGHATGVAEEAETPFRVYDATLPPLSDRRTHQVHWRSREVAVRIREDLAIAAWTFEGDVPGPILHVRQGDTVEFTLTNEGNMPHSMDFHAAQIDPKVAFRSVRKGESVSFTFQPRHAGAFMYHCGTGPVLMHIGAGMYGAIIVSPPEPLPAAREFVLVQSEFYLGDAANGVAPLDFNKMASTMPDYVVFNGRPDQYIRNPLRVRRGERVRFYVVSAGPTHPCNFHIVGEQFDNVWLGAPPSNPLRGVQTFAVPPGGGMIFDFVADIPGEFPFVNHGFGHGQKGAIGFLVVEE